MSADDRLDDIPTLRNYPQQPRYLLAALQDTQAVRGAISEAAFASLAQQFHADEATAEALRPLFAVQAAESNGISICNGAVCRRFGLLQMMQESGSDTITACDCLGLCDQAPAALYRGEKIPHASVELLQRRRFGKS